MRGWNKETVIEIMKYIKVKIWLMLSYLIATWFYIGKLPAPGTCAAASVYPIYHFIVKYSGSCKEVKLILFISTIALYILGYITIKDFQKRTNTFDHNSIVIDEVIGQLLTLALSFESLYSIINQTHNIMKISNEKLIFLAAFIVFRIFDIIKPSVIGYMDLRYKNACGVIFDDVLAAVFSSLLFYYVDMLIKLFVHFS